MRRDSVLSEEASVYKEGFFCREVISWKVNNLHFYTVGSFGFSALALESPVTLNVKMIFVTCLM